MQNIVEISQKRVEIARHKEARHKKVWVQLHEVLKEREKKKQTNAKWQKDQWLLDFELGQGRLTVNIMSNICLGAYWLFVPIYTDMLTW